MTHGCAVVKTDNVSSFHTAELCLYLYSPHEVAGWQVDREENQVISNELMLRGFASSSSCSAFSYGTSECAKLPNLTEAMKSVCVKQYSEDFNAKRREVIDRYARMQSNQNQALSRQNDSLQKSIDYLERQQEKWSPFKKPF
jgi:hypothetical protein